jgi:hypothetical protein
MISAGYEFWGKIADHWIYLDKENNRHIHLKVMDKVVHVVDITRLDNIIDSEDAKRLSIKLFKEIYHNKEPIIMGAKNKPEFDINKVKQSIKECNL